MNEQDLFNTPAEEVKRLVEELREAKEMLREVSRKLSQIEMRMRRSFPSFVPKQAPKRRSEPSQLLSEQPTLTTEQAMQVYQELVIHARKNEHHVVHERLSALNLEDLNLLRRELGVSLGKKKPSRQTLEVAIIGRVKESVLLSKHTHRDDILEQAGRSPDPSEEDN